MSPAWTGWLLLAVIAMPALTSLALLTMRWASDRTASVAGLVCSGLTLAGAAAATVPIVRAEATPELNLPWIPALGVRFHLRLDAISAPLVLLTAGLGLLVVLQRALSSWSNSTSAASQGDPAVSEPRNERGLVACLLAVECSALGTFLAADLIVFFVAFEAVLVPMWAIIARWGDPGDLAARRDAANRFVLFTVLGSTLMMLGIVLIWLRAGTTDLSALAARGGLGLSPSVQLVAAILITLGLAIKIPIFPLHTWLPPAHSTAPTAGSVLLAGVLLKMGTYALIRVVLGVVPAGFERIAPIVGAFAVASIWWASLACFAERDLKRLIAFSSVAHMGFVVLGIASMTTIGVQGALFANVAHGLISALLFLVAGALKDRYHTTTLADLGRGLRDRLPRLGWVLAFAAMAALGLPGLAGFWGEMLSIAGAWQLDSAIGPLARPLAGLAAVGAVMTVAYLLRMLRLLWQGGDPQDALAEPEPDLTGAETTVLVPIGVLVLVLGLLPGLLLNLTGPAVRALLGVS